MVSSVHRSKWHKASNIVKLRRMIARSSRLSSKNFVQLIFCGAFLQHLLHVVDTFSTCTSSLWNSTTITATAKTFRHEKMCIRFIDFCVSINLPWHFSMHQTSPAPSNVKTHTDTKQRMLRGFDEETFKSNSICGQMEFLTKRTELYVIQRMESKIN